MHALLPLLPTNNFSHVNATSDSHNFSAVGNALTNSFNEASTRQDSHHAGVSVLLTDVVAHRDTSVGLRFWATRHNFTGFQDFYMQANARICL